ncbi:MAG: zinc dependent phospholipase C family protein [Betaproteobacteria bacterium]|nr:zinc dependent phospholipase C family protein [Betaproteobacteria bacterium]
MAGIFTHLAVVRSIYADYYRLSGISELTPEIKFALQMYANFVDLGSVSPDTPYFYAASLDEEANSWSNVMHYWRTGDFIREAISRLREEDYTQKDTQKAIAWLFGYTAHVITDLTVHPIIELRVGPYATNKEQHRFCELQQDAYMFFHTLGMDAASSDYIKSAGLKSCTNGPNSEELHSKVADLWEQCASAIKPSSSDVDYVFGAIPTTPPKPKIWFRWFCQMIDKGEEEAYQIPVLSYFLLKYGFALPKDQNAIDMSYVSNLATPDGGRADFPAIFEMTVNNTIKYWGELAAALRKESPKPFSLPNGNLDSGKITQTDTLIFWDKTYVV